MNRPAVPRRRVGLATGHHPTFGSAGKERSMLAFIPDFMTDGWFIILMIVLFLALLGLLLFLRSRKTDDE
jgi:hypothetical protein